MQLPATAKSPLSQSLLIGAAAGLVATAMTGVVDRLLDRLVSEEQKHREKQVRPGPPHALAGPVLGEKLLDRQLTRGEKRRATPQVSRAAGLPFAVPFFVACDGTIAPLLKLTPTLEKVPWQLNAKELGNYLAWAVSAEMAYRYGERLTS